MQSAKAQMYQDDAPNYAVDKEKCLTFLSNYTVDGSKAKYKEILQDVANRKRVKIQIPIDDIKEYFEAQNDENFVRNVEGNTKRYCKLFSDAIDDIMPEPTARHVTEDVLDFLQRTRLEVVEQHEGVQDEPMDVQDQGQVHLERQIPADLMRRYELFITPSDGDKPMLMRQVNARFIGKLVRVKGIVTHVTDVKPLLSVATYLDLQQGTQLYQEVLGRQYVPLPPTLKVKDVFVEPVLQIRGSKFVRFQEVKLQEMSSEVPQGATPRSISLHLNGSLTRTCKPGDVVVVSGIFLPEPFTGFKAMRAGLLTRTHIEVQQIKQVKESYSDHHVSMEDLELIRRLDAEGNIYHRLASSIAPEIFGHEDIKKALLLLMVGGVTKELEDGMKLRGDLHMCLMGDPGVAKSQLLKHICSISPRGVYTTGKGSSGVGLTAAVTRDATTNEMVLEGGALVLADKGICCIDEFDKMEEGDRTAIHEVMEQQTVSIAKAGITTTLNTRTAVLAAANPAWGRYDTSRSPAENIALPAALLSRFDLLFLILDRPDREADRALAEHVLNVHAHGAPPPLPEGLAPLTPKQLRTYISAAKQCRPTVPPSLTDYVTEVYAHMRKEEAAAEKPHSYTTARTLLSILRLSQALAKLQFKDEVQTSDVDEALRLMKMSKISLLDDPRPESSRRATPVERIYDAIRQHLGRSSARFLTTADIQQLCPTEDMAGIMECLEEYEMLGVWQRDHNADGTIAGIFATVPDDPPSAAR